MQRLEDVLSPKTHKETTKRRAETSEANHEYVYDFAQNFLKDFSVPCSRRRQE